MAAFVNTIGVAFWVLGAVVAKRHLGGAAAWATILVGRAIGLLAGGTVLLRFEPRRPLLAATPACAAAALPILLLAIPARVVLIVPAALLAGAGAVTFNTLRETTLQLQVPVQARSRVSAYDWFGSLAFQPLGYALMGPLSQALGLAGALYLCGALELVAVVPLLMIPEIRTITRPRRGETGADAVGILRGRPEEGGST